MVENKISEEVEPEVKVPIPEKEKIDLSEVKVLSNKTKCYYPVEPQNLVLFKKNSEKCEKCGFIKKHCQCEKKMQMDINFLELRLLLRLKLKLIHFIHKIFHKRVEKEILCLKVLRDYHQSRLEKYYTKYEFHQKKCVQLENQLNNSNFLPDRIM